MKTIIETTFKMKIENYANKAYWTEELDSVKNEIEAKNEAIKLLDSFNGSLETGEAKINLLAIIKIEIIKQETIIEI